MANTQSLAFPNMFQISQNKVGVYEDNKSIVNRCRLLMLTEPTELYKNPDFGVGLKQYLFQYNTSNTKKMIQSKIINKLDLFEPCVIPDETKFADGLLVTEQETVPVDQEYNRLKMTVGLVTKFSDIAELSIENENS